MAVSIDQLFSEFNLRYSKAVKWNKAFEAKFNGVYVISQTDDPFAEVAKNLNFNISAGAFSDWLKEAPGLKIHGKKVENIDALKGYLSEFWNPAENILYIGQSSSETNPIEKRVRQFYSHKLGQKGPHTGGYWMKLLDHLEDTFVFYASADNPRDTEFKMLMRFIEWSSGKSFYELENIGFFLPFANLTADFDKVHAITNPTNKNKKKNAR